MVGDIADRVCICIVTITNNVAFINCVEIQDVRYDSYLILNRTVAAFSDKINTLL